MNCMICLEKYNCVNRIPKNFPCGHTFCNSCIQNILITKALECPNCRVKGSKTLPICYPIYDILVLNAQKEQEVFCSFHHNKTIKYYCLIDSIGICDICVITMHKGHKVSTIQDGIYIKQTKEKLIKWMKYVDLKREEYIKKEKNLIEVIQYLRENTMIKKEEIDSKYREYESMWTSNKETFVIRLKEKYEKIKAVLRSIKEQVTNVMLDYEIVINSINTSNDKKIDNVYECAGLDRKFDKIIELIQENNMLHLDQIEYSDQSIITINKSNTNELIPDNKHNTNGKIIFFGDYSTRQTLMYNIKDKQWSTISPIGTNYNYLDNSSSISINHSLILLTGGCKYINYPSTTSNQSFLCFFSSDHSSISFHPFSKLKQARFSHGSARINNHIFVYGGHNGLLPLASMEMIDISSLNDTTQWETVQSDMIFPREIFSSCVMRNRFIYVFGGFNTANIDTIEWFDYETMKWTLAEGKMIKALQNTTAVPLNDDNIALIGGFNDVLLSSIQVFNIVTQTWITVEHSMKYPRQKCHCYVIDKDTMIVLGGQGNEIDFNIPEKITLIIDNNDKQWKCYDEILETNELIENYNMTFWTSAKL